MKNTIIIILVGLWLIGCSSASDNHLQLDIYQTSAAGDKLTFITPTDNQGKSTISIKLNPDLQYQTITGFGGAFTESSA